MAGVGACAFHLSIAKRFNTFDKNTVRPMSEAKSVPLDAGRGPVLAGMLRFLVLLQLSSSQQTNYTSVRPPTPLIGNDTLGMQALGYATAFTCYAAVSTLQRR